MAVATKKRIESRVRQILLELVKNGTRLEQVALNLGVSYATLMAWKQGTREPRQPMRMLMENLYGGKVS